MPRQIGSSPENSSRYEETRVSEPVTAPVPDVSDQMTDDGTLSRSARAEGKKSHTGLWITLGVLAVAACIGAYFFLNTNRAIAAYDDQTQILDDGTYYKGVSINNVDVSGMTLDEAREAVNAVAESELADMHIKYRVNEDEYELTAAELGAAIDTETVLAKAMELGRTGPFDKRQSEIMTTRNRGTNFEIDYTFDENKVKAAVAEDLAPYADTAKNAQVKLNTTADEGSKMTDYSLEFTDEQSGIGVEQDKLVADILTAAKEHSTEMIEAQTTVLEPEVTREMLENQYAVRGIYETSYGSSAEGRRYNIWKMSSIINGVEIAPGETWSINEEAGPRTYALGWKGAPGISDGAYQEEAGGGICQVSSTLYNAVLRAEVDVAERTHHSWPLDYVPGGLDATISTGAPDFKIHNNLNVPIFIGARCDGSGRTVEVAIIGPDHGDGLTRDFFSELVGTTPAGGTIEVKDSSLPAGTRQSIIRAHEGKTFNVYKRYFDADGNQVGDTELYMKDTYAPKPAKVRVGTGASKPAPVEEPVYREPEPQAPEPAPQPDPEPAPPEPAPEQSPAEGTEG